VFDEGGVRYGAGGGLHDVIQWTGMTVL
jgi:hypothetical protein